MALYGEGQVFVAELVGTTVFCVVGLGAIANTLLPGTKGHGFGFVGISLGFGLAVFLPLQIFGHISGFFNPAIALAAAVVKDITWKRFAVCACADMLGGILGGMLVWLTYLPHFQPLQLVKPTEDSVICDCCDVEANGVAIIKQELSQPAQRYASAGSREKNMTLAEVELQDLELHMNSFWLGLKRRILRRSSDLELTASSEKGSVNKLHKARAKSVNSACGPNVRQRIAEDQEVKLTVFVTRPSIPKRFWFHCFWAEFFLTFLLTYGAFAIINRGKLTVTNVAENELYTSGLEPALIGLLVFALVLSGGGMTGPALNPARDLGPRMVHWLLPIPGKGTSEWWYSWVPVIAPCVGAVLGGSLPKP